MLPYYPVRFIHEKFIVLVEYAFVYESQAPVNGALVKAAQIIYVLRCFFHVYISRAPL
jgi:hypothetical protein